MATGALLGGTEVAHADRLWTERTNTTVAMTPDDDRARMSFKSLVKDLAPAVVFISVEKEQRGGRNNHRHEVQGLGTGFIIHEDGWVVTNNHVVSEGRIRVRLSNDRQYDARVVGMDPQTDIALVKFEPEERLTVAPLGDSDRLDIGDWVIAIGNPFGLSHSVTAGIVSAKGRANVAPEGNVGLYEDFIQTDASINPGNSGGPLINMRGEVVGVNTAINRAGQGLAFSVPINMVKTILPQLKEHGEVRRSMLGILIQDIDATMVSGLGLADARGSLVTEVVPNGPAGKAKIQAGDVIVRFDGKPVGSSRELRWLSSNAGVGRTVPVEVIRESKPIQVPVTLSALDQRTSVATPPKPKALGQGQLGVGIATLTPELQAKYGAEVGEGVVVTEVIPGSPAERAGLQVGDVIQKLGQSPTPNAEALQAALSRMSESPVVTLVIHREGRQLFKPVQR